MDLENSSAPQQCNISFPGQKQGAGGGNCEDNDDVDPMLTMDDGVALEYKEI